MSHTENTLNPSEKILRIVYRHPINVFPVFISTVIVLLGILIAAYFVGRYPESFTDLVSVATVMLVLASLAGIMVLIFLVALFIYRQNRLIITNQNVVQIEQNGLFNRTLSKLSHEDIQDFNGNKKGFLATILNYGDVIIETAGEIPNFTFIQAPNPTGLVEYLSTIHIQMARHQLIDRSEAMEASEAQAVPGKL